MTSEPSPTATSGVGEPAPDSESPLALLALFRDLDREFVRELTSLAEEQAYSEGDLLAVEGEPGDCLYLIASGHVEISVRDTNGEAIVLTYLGPGEYVGELSLLDGRPRSATVRVIDPCVCLRLGREEFQRALAARPHVALALLPALAERLRDADHRIAELASQVVGRPSAKQGASVLREAYRSGLLNGLG
ncbi:MAG: cyclic nucleotide-binding domain-containing protein [Chloroflexi bacterium]|nr:cyclic nucleotide-binding domain-containing protein [Chloroflexota bacterium]